MKIEKTILGPPGCGKTQTNSNLIQGYIKEGIEPQRIACVSLVRKRQEKVKNVFAMIGTYLMKTYLTSVRYILWRLVL